MKANIWREVLMEPLSSKGWRNLRKKIADIVHSGTIKPEEIPQLKKMLEHLQNECDHNRIISLNYSALMSAGGRAKKHRFCLSCGLKETSTGSFKDLVETTIRNFKNYQERISTHPLIQENWGKQAYW